MRFITRFRTRLRYLNTEMIALYYSLKHPRTPFMAKALVFATLGYVVSPIDFIPDFIPFLGLLDDLVIFPFMMGAAIRFIPSSVMEEGRMRARRVVRTAMALMVIGLLLLIVLIYWIVSKLF
jgi:uncharacterized membrane protein YkvA (DUF1232 family)